jgi:hypothetical protein
MAKGFPTKLSSTGKKKGHPDWCQHGPDVSGTSELKPLLGNKGHIVASLCLIGGYFIGP